MTTNKTNKKKIVAELGIFENNPNEEDRRGRLIFRKKLTQEEFDKLTSLSCHQQPENEAHPEPSREWEEKIKSIILSERTALVEEIAEAIKNLTVEEAPPFSANNEIRDKAKIINKYLLPAVKERLLSTINFLTKTK